MTELISTGIALCGLATTLLVQCGEKRMARKKAAKSKKNSAKSISAKQSLRQTESKNGSVISSKKSIQQSDRAVKPSGEAVSSKRTEVSAVKNVHSPIQAGRAANVISSEVAITEITPAPEKQLSLKSARASKRSNKESKSEAGVLTAREAPAKQAEAKEREDEIIVEKTAVAGRSKSDLSLGSLKSIEDMAIETKTGREVSKKDVPLGLQMEPKELRFSDEGGLIKVRLHNPTNTRQAVKVKCTDNAIYRVNPVYAFLEPGQELNFEVVRQSGISAKADKLVFVTAKAPAENVSVKDLFKSARRSETPMMTLPLRAA